MPIETAEMGTVPFSPGGRQEAGDSGQSISKSQISKSPNPRSPIPFVKGAGNVLLRLMVEDSFHRGDYLIDLGPEAFDYKRRWATARAAQLPLSALRPHAPQGPSPPRQTLAHPQPVLSTSGFPA